MRPLASLPVAAAPSPAALPSRRRPAVLLTRPAAATPALRRALGARGLRLLVQPLLSVRPLPGPLPPTDDAQGVIVTSAEALRGIGADAFPAPIPVFVVGQATAVKARAAGFDDVRPSADAQDLALAVRSACSPPHGPLVYLAGRHRARDLARMLGEFEIRLAERYAAEPVHRLSPAVRAAVCRGEVRAVLLYSGRAARTFADVCRREGLEAAARAVPALCLSRRIAAKMQARGWRIAWGAPLPQAERLTSRLLGRRFSADAVPPLADATCGASFVPLSTREETMSRSPSATRETAARPPSGQKSVAPHWVAIVAVAALAAVASIWLWSELRTSDARRDALAANQAALATRIDDLAKVPTFADPITVDRLVVEVDGLARRASENAQAVTAIGERVDVAAATLGARLDTQADRIAALDRGAGERAERLEQRLGGVEQKLGGRLDGLEARLAALAAQAEAVTAGLAELAAKQAAEAEGVRTDLAQLADRVTADLATLSAAAADLEQRLGAIEHWAERAQPARVAEQLVALAELRRLVEAGAPFATPLQRVRAVLPAAADLPVDQGWAAHAERGLPTAEGLRQQLAEIARGRPRASPVESGSSWVDSAVGTLLKGVRIEGETPLGADPVGNALRAGDEALATGDLAAADAAVAPIAERLPAVVQWRALLQARQDALAAIAAWDQTVLAGIDEAAK